MPDEELSAHSITNSNKWKVRRDSGNMTSIRANFRWQWQKRCHSAVKYSGHDRAGYINGAMIPVDGATFTRLASPTFE